MYYGQHGACPGDETKSTEERSRTSERNQHEIPVSHQRGYLRAADPRYGLSDRGGFDNDHADSREDQCADTQKRISGLPAIHDGKPGHGGVRQDDRYRRPGGPYSERPAFVLDE